MLRMVGLVKQAPYRSTMVRFLPEGVSLAHTGLMLTRQSVFILP